MKQMLKDFRPSCFEDLILLVAAYRPGPMQYIPDVIAVKHGRKKMEYPIKELEPILKTTYGKTIYQEQVQEILECFEQDDAGTVIKYMHVDGLERQVDPAATMRIIEDITKTLPEATEVNKKQVMKRIQDVVATVGKKRMEAKLQLERNKVRQFVFNAVDGEYYKISPRIANIIARYLESIV